MIRSLATALRASRTAAAPALRPLAFRAPLPSSSALAFVKARSYAASAGLSKEDVLARVMDVMKTFEKVDGGKLSPTASFTTDLGLDSLDAVEVVMAIEEEFGIEIPDAEADEITNVAQAVDYVTKTPEAH